MKTIPLSDQETETGFEVLKVCCGPEKLKAIETFHEERRHVSQDCLNCPFCSIPDSSWTDDGYGYRYLNSDGEFYIDCELLEQSVWAEYPSIGCFSLWDEFLNTN